MSLIRFRFDLSAAPRRFICRPSISDAPLPGQPFNASRKLIASRPYASSTNAAVVKAPQTFMENLQRGTHQLTADEKIVRKLGLFESHHIALHTLGQTRACVLAYRYAMPPRLAVPSARPELMQSVETTIARIVLKHPVLQVGIIGEESAEPSWIFLRSINLHHHIKWKVLGKNENFRHIHTHIFRSELDTTFTNFRDAPAWKVVVLHQDESDFIEVFLVINHTLMDGSGANTFHMDLLRGLNDAATSHIPILPPAALEDHVLTLPDTCSNLPPPAEDLVVFPVDSSLRQKFIMEEVDRPGCGVDRPTFANWAPILTFPVKTQVRDFSIDYDTFANILKACRMHNTTFTGLLHALTLVSLAPLLNESAAPGFESLTAMDLRRFLPSHPPSHPWLEPAHAMVNYPSLMIHAFDARAVAKVRSMISLQRPDPYRSAELMEGMWSIAEKVRKDIDRRLDMGLQNDITGLWQYIKDWRWHLSEQVKRPRRFSWTITNMGAVNGTSYASDPRTLGGVQDLSERDHWAIRRTQVAMGASVPFAALCISPVAVKGGELIVTCTWQDSIFDTRLGDRFAAELERWLKFTARFHKGWPAQE